LSALHVHLSLIDNIIWDEGSGQKNQALIKTGAAKVNLFSGMANFFCGSFGSWGDIALSVPSSEPPPFVVLSSGEHDRAGYALAKPDPRISGNAAPILSVKLPSALISDLNPRPDNPDIGAVPVGP
jgi:hypothetical protein